jgi:DNA polymerase III subunit epsilon
MIALHVLPTGPVPWRDHILAVAALRFQGRRVTGRFSTLVRPLRRPGRYALEALERTDSDFDAAPVFAQIEPELRDFLATETLVGFNIKVTLEFLAAELSRSNVPGLENDCLELVDLARESGVTVHKPGLNYLAAALGLNAAPAGRPDASARLTAQIAARLLDMVDPNAGTDALPKASVLPDRWALLDPTRVRGVAEVPGVYVFRDRDGEVLYAGASGNLRRRLATYQSRPLELERRLEGLAERVWDIETHPTDGYLEALIDEARLIDTHAPPFNVHRQTRMPRRFLRASTGSKPGLRTVDAVMADGSIYLGPFASARAANEALALTRAVYPELGRRPKAISAAPARRPTAADRLRTQELRAQAVRDALVLLSGQREPALRLVRERAGVAANAGNHVETARLRELSAAIARFELSPSPLRDGPGSRFAVTMLDSDGIPRLVYHLAAGRILERHELAEGAALDLLVARWRAERPMVTPDLEGVPLIMRWLATQGRRCKVTSLPRVEMSSGL